MITRKFHFWLQLICGGDYPGRWLDVRMRNAASPRLDNELAGLIALTAGHRALYPGLPSGARDWALSQLRIETETPPDEPVIGLRAWERRLAGSGAD